MNDQSPPKGGAVDPTATAPFNEARADHAAKTFFTRPPVERSKHLATRFEAFDRLGRPALRWAGVAIIVLVGLAIAVGFWISVITGRPMPDLTAGLLPVLTVMGPQVIDLVTRHFEVTGAHARPATAG